MHPQTSTRCGLAPCTLRGMSAADEAQEQVAVQQVYMKGLQVFFTGVLEHFRSTTVFIPPPPRALPTRATELGSLCPIVPCMSGLMHVACGAAQC